MEILFTSWSLILCCGVWSYAAAFGLILWRLVLFCRFWFHASVLHLMLWPQFSLILRSLVSCCGSWSYSVTLVLCCGFFSFFFFSNFHAEALGFMLWCFVSWRRFVLRCGASFVPWPLVSLCRTCFHAVASGLM